MVGPIQIGRYVLHDVIASGGMASVHFGRLVGTGGFAKTVAIKRLHRQFSREPEFRKMILEEGRLAARIRHPNVVPPLDVLSEGNELLLVMEYVHGESLSRLLRATWAAMERVPIPICAAVMTSVLHGLHAAHEAKDEAGVPLNIVHRDVSPQNVIVGSDGTARVIDFGIAKAVTSGESTTVGTVKGKVPYLAPEQLEGEPATRRTDIYAASVVLWESLAGQRLFGGADDSEILRQILDLEVRRPSEYNPNVPRELDAVVLQGLARKPADRFATAREMALAIEGAVHLATASTVGAWVELHAREELEERAAILAQVENAATPLEVADTSTIKRKAPSSRREPTDGLLDLSGDADPIVDETVVAPARAPDASFPPSSRNAPAVVLGSTAEMPKVEATHPPPAGALRKPGLEIANVEWLPTNAPSAQIALAAPAKKRGLLGPLIFFLFIVIVGGWLGAPFLIRRLVVQAAARNGVTMTIDRVHLTRKSIRFVDVKAESSELPGVSVHAASVLVELRRITPDRMTIDDLDVGLEGSWSAATDKIDAWQRAHGAGVQADLVDFSQIVVASGRVEWKDAVGAGTGFVLENVSVEATKTNNRPIGEDWHFLAPLVTAHAGITSAGPWQLESERQSTVTKHVLRFDPIGTYRASVTVATSTDGATSVKLDIPPTPLADLHVPPAIFGALATDKTRIEGKNELTFITAPGAKTRQASGRLVVAVGSVVLAPASSPVDVSLDVPVTFAGDVGQPIPLAATLAIAPADPNGVASTPTQTAKLTGKLELGKGAPRIDLDGKLAPYPCDKPAVGQLAITLFLNLDAASQTKTSFVRAGCAAPRK